jgi:transposase
MLYLAIDQHAKQLTVNLRDESGAILLRQQVSTKPDKVRQFLSELRERSVVHGGYLAILEVCGFNDWLLALLAEYGCVQTVLVQSEHRSKTKTDRRDANRLGEALWMNRLRVLQGLRLQELRRIEPPSAEDAAARQLTALRKVLAVGRTRVLNRIASILKKHNLQHDCPVKKMQTKAARAWLTELKLPAVDRLEMTQLLARWQLWDDQIAEVTMQIATMKQTHAAAAVVSTVPGLSGYSGLAIASRIGDIRRFRKPASLANFFGLAPSARNSGESNRRLGSITKRGSAICRFLLGQAALHVLRKDPVMRSWYRAIKARRGTKIARVAVMRRIATAIWHMLTFHEPYRSGGSPARREAGQRPRKRAATPDAEPGHVFARRTGKEPAGPPGSFPEPHPPSPLLCCPQR